VQRNEAAAVTSRGQGQRGARLCIVRNHRLEQTVAVGRRHPKVEPRLCAKEAGKFSIEPRNDRFKVRIGLKGLLRRAQAVAFTEHRLRWLTRTRGYDAPKEFRAEGHNPIPSSTSRDQEKADVSDQPGRHSSPELIDKHIRHRVVVVEVSRGLHFQRGTIKASAEADLAG
jgi:hypothetical protein